MTKQKTIRILIAEDSAVIFKLLQIIFADQKDLVVIGHAKNGREAVEMTKSLRPDLVTMDIRMPEMDGFEATRQIMAEQPTPIVVISSNVNEAELNITFNALNAGALTVIEKPQNVLSSGFEASKRSLINTIRALSEVHVIKRRPNLLKKAAALTTPQTFSHQDCQVFALGASTGGPEALFGILSQLPCNFPVPIVIVQHITKGFLAGLVTWLQKSCALRIKIAADYETLEAGTIYFAPDDSHTLIKQGAKGPYIRLNDDPPVDSFKPSVTKLFSSLAQSFPGKSAAGLLTGMGRDGADGLLEMRQKLCYTFIQSQQTCVVFGMPGQALAINAAEDVIDLAAIPEYIIKLFSGENKC